MGKDLGKPVILIINFGTLNEEGMRDQENIDKMVTARYPDHEVRWAIASGVVRDGLKKAGQTTLFARKTPVMNLADTYADLRKQGRRDVAVQFLFTVPGSDGTDDLMMAADGLNVEYGYALLAPPDNIARVTKALEPRFSGKDTVTIIFTNGNDTVPIRNWPLIQMDRYLRKHYKNVFLTTLGGKPGVEAAAADARKSGLKKVKYIPFYFVVGKNAIYNIMGDTPNTLKSKVGLEASIEPGLAWDKKVMSIWMESIDWSLAKFSR
ncbi:MAG: hypothetical protein C4555_02555 [Dehalococcoidia bacterium]|jgi:sirohydrochlorin cobaltochelatase|nr:MAG: hypothetical protein C4555_02555 [Dehalococcoidia bacterium]